MPVIKLTMQAIESSAPSTQPYEPRDTEVKGFLCKIAPSGRKVFMLAYRNRHGQKRKPAIGPFGVYTVQEAREVARKWLLVTVTFTVSGKSLAACTMNYHPSNCYFRRRR